MRVIFLDIDGVLNNGKESRLQPIWSNKLMNKDTIFSHMVSPSNFKPVLDLFNYCFNHDIKICVSSSWRELTRTNHLDGLRYYFGYYLIDKIYVGITPIIRYPSGRGDEIREYMKDKTIEKYIIIDDDYDRSFKGLSVITTNFNKGLTERHVLKIKEYFEKGV